MWLTLRSIFLLLAFLTASANAAVAPPQQQSLTLSDVQNVNFAIFQASNAGVVIPTADLKCTITTGNCTGTGGGSSLFTAATCNGVADDVTAFNSFNSWAVGTWQAAHPGLLLELDVPTGKVCEFIGGNVNSNLIGQGLKNFQIVGYGATLADNNGTGGGFALGAGGVRFDSDFSVLFATISAGATSITILDTSKCGIFSNGDETLLAGIDPQGFGDPPNPQIYEYIQINSVASCAGTGVITLTTPTLYGYKSTWPLYNAGRSGLNSSAGGPATVYALNQQWVTNQAFYGLTINQAGAQTNSNGQFIAFYDLTVPPGQQFCPIPSQNQTWSITNGSMPTCAIEVDKIVVSASMTNVTFHRLIFQSGSNPQSFSCTRCNIDSVSGSAGNTTYTNSVLSDLQIGSTEYGVAGSFSATNTVISALEIGGSSMPQIFTRGVWASGTLTVPPNMSVLSYADNGLGSHLTRLTVPSTAGWATGIVGDGCGGTFPVTVIDGTHVDLQGLPFSAGVCAGTAGFGSLPLTWAIPRANVYFSSSQAPLGPIFQVADLSVGANNATVVSFNLNGSPYAGGFPTIPGPSSSFTITAHPAPSWSCIGCAGSVQGVLDISGAAAAGLPYASYASRVLTAANSNTTGMNVFGQLTELDMTVTAACGGASNAAFEQTMVTTTLNSASFGSWNPTVNGLIASATPRVIQPTTSSGAQSGDSLVTPGAGTWLVAAQTVPFYSTVGNCGSAATTITVQTNQGVVYPFLLKRDLDPTTNDNSPMWLDEAA